MIVTFIMDRTGTDVTIIMDRTGTTVKEGELHKSQIMKFIFVSEKTNIVICYLSCCPMWCQFLLLFNNTIVELAISVENVMESWQQKLLGGDPLLT